MAPTELFQCIRNVYTTCHTMLRPLQKIEYRSYKRIRLTTTVLFNSFEFIFVFLPATLVFYYFLCSRKLHTEAKVWLILASLFFYGWWTPVYLLLIILSILVNYSLGVRLADANRKSTLVVGIAFNLGLLGYFKYANFFVGSLNTVLDTNFHLETIILPLAISFFTFQQIAYLVDAFRQETKEYNFLSYCLFVTFFPQLIAGPIVHHKQMLPQFDNRRAYSLDSKKFAIGLSIFFFGLFKKVVLADNIASYGTPVFSAADAGAQISLFEAWGGALSYTFQLYFDFSGYSDMAIGIALLFGIYLPVNFNSPYKSVSISEFWRRWHMTLSAFLRDYLYFALGGNRVGKVKRYVNLMITMLLGGLWHGAGWNFIVWGGLHGAYLVINHGWAGLRSEKIIDVFGYRIACRALTFLAVVIGWVFFRAETMGGALSILSGMIGQNGAVLDARLAAMLPFLQSIVTFEGRQAGSFQLQGVGWIVGLAIIAFFSPNVVEIMRYSQRERSERERVKVADAKNFWHWKPSSIWCFAIVAIGSYSIFSLNKLSEFLYFQF